MSKSMIVIDTPRCCGECYLFKYKAEEMLLDGFAYTYIKLFRCRLEPEGLCEDDGDIVYLNGFIYEGKPPWCPLKELQEGE